MSDRREKSGPGFLDTFWGFTSDLVVLDPGTQEIKEVPRQSKLKQGDLAMDCLGMQDTVEHATMSLDVSFSDQVLGADQNSRGAAAKTSGVGGGGGGAGGGERGGAERGVSYKKDRDEQGPTSKDVLDSSISCIYILIHM